MLATRHLHHFYSTYFSFASNVMWIISYDYVPLYHFAFCFYHVKEHEDKRKTKEKKKDNDVSKYMLHSTQTLHEYVASLFDHNQLLVCRLHQIQHLFDIAPAHVAVTFDIDNLL